MRRRGQQPKDHARDNVLAIREAQRQLQLRKEEEEELAEAENRRFKLAQFEGVEARFMTAAEKAAEGASKKQFLKRTSSMGPPPRPSKPHQPRPSVKPPVPKVVEAAPRVRACARRRRPGATRRADHTRTVRPEPLSLRLRRRQSRRPATSSATTLARRCARSAPRCRRPRSRRCRSPSAARPSTLSAARRNGPSRSGAGSRRRSASRAARTA